jgi:hypothetical protein
MNVVVRLWTEVPRVKTTDAAEVKFEPVIVIEKPGLPADAVEGAIMVRPTAPMVKNWVPVEGTLPF